MKPDPKTALPKMPRHRFELINGCHYWVSMEVSKYIRKLEKENERLKKWKNQKGLNQ